MFPISQFVLEIFIIIIIIIIISAKRLCFHLNLSVCLSVCLSIAKISQNVLDRCSCGFVEGLAVDQGPNH